MISPHYLILLCMTALTLSSIRYSLSANKELDQQGWQRQKRHLVYLEMIYYIRNEINDGFYSSFSYHDHGWEIKAEFDRMNQKAFLLIDDGETAFWHTFSYDPDCRCLTGFTEGKDR